MVFPWLPTMVVPGRTGNGSFALKEAQKGDASLGRVSSFQAPRFPEPCPDPMASGQRRSARAASPCAWQTSRTTWRSRKPTRRSSGARMILAWMAVFSGGLNAKQRLGIVFLALGPPVVPFYFCGGGGFPSENRVQKIGYPYSNLSSGVTGGPSQSVGQVLCSDSGPTCKPVPGDAGRGSCSNWRPSTQSRNKSNPDIQ